MAESKHDVLAEMAFAGRHHAKLHSTNPLERLDKELKRRANVVGTVPNEASNIRLLSAVLHKQNDEWPRQQRNAPVQGVLENRGDK